ncbi:MULTISPECIES: hypothetical protein [Kitasatospora]|uniref:Uncharacterized protein n=2 Tax=Kitasatospora TaxID=2063 RepID=A0ABT1IRJ4_9ACTN|nr:hypothetical protein [Kitasatospora paracochleata]MCP2307719.1 hypothetical protein [Kitasatospora paracochleata]
MRTTRAFDLAYRLAVAAGARARVRRRPDGGYRVEAEIPGDLGEEAHRAVLTALAAADRFGHVYLAASHSVWAEIDEESTQ